MNERLRKRTLSLKHAVLGCTDHAEGLTKTRRPDGTFAVVYLTHAVLYYERVGSNLPTGVAFRFAPELTDDGRALLEAVVRCVRPDTRLVRVSQTEYIVETDHKPATVYVNKWVVLRDGWHPAADAPQPNEVLGQLNLI